MEISHWRELTTRKEEFQRILKLLIAFDEKVGRHIRYEAHETHWARHAISSADPSRVRVLMKRISDCVYTIVCECRSSSAIIIASWVHEDGIKSERETAATDHPVHKIICISDLFEGDSMRAVDPESLNPFAAELLAETARGK